MRHTFLLLFLLSLSAALNAGQPVYSRVKIHLDQKPLSAVMQTGIEIQEINLKEGFAVGELAEPEIKLLQDAGFKIEILVPDMEKFYVSRNKNISKSATNMLSDKWPVPVNFSLGSCGGFSTIDQMLAQLDKMHELFPSLITVRKPVSDTIKTWEGRNVYFVKISDNAGADEDEPEILYTGMHHAREPIGMQHLLYYMWYLLENYNTNPDIKALVDHTEMYFVPVFNVDGYQYNIDNSPYGGGMYRKNRRNSGNGNYGVDINRNYGYSWGYDNSGSSPSSSSETYRGARAFSEPETRMMKQFCENRNFKFAINYHSYSNLCLYPWGYIASLCDDDSLFSQFSKLMTAENGYTYGPACSTIYPTNGGSDDWMYGEQTTKGKIFAYTPEIGTSFDGFWPTQDRIIPLIQENMLTSLSAARLAGNYGLIADNNPLYIDKTNGYLHFSIKRLGLLDGDFKASIITIGNSIAQTGDDIVISGMKTGETRSDSIPFVLSPDLSPGDTVRYVLRLNSGSSITGDTVMHIFGAPQVLFDDRVDDASNWKGTWQRTTSDYYSPAGCMTDSPFGQYSYNSVKIATLAGNISIPNKPQVVLQFMAKWDIEKFYDYVQLSISNDNGISWTPLKGKYTVDGSLAQDPGNPVYDGKQDQWVREDISLNDYRGQDIRLKFTLLSDNQNQRDGYYFDDLTVSWLPDYTPVCQRDKVLPALGEPYPNPSLRTFSVQYSFLEADKSARLILFSADLKQVQTIDLEGNSGIKLLDVSKLKPGFYFLAAESAGLITAMRKVMIATH